MLIARRARAHYMERVAASKRKRARYEIDSDRFVRVWMAAKSIEDVCEAMKLPRHIAYAHAKRLRDAGVQLKSFHRSTLDARDVERLNAIVQQATGGK